jgi:hypothetical protein
VLFSECCSWIVDHCNFVPLNQQWTLHFLHMFSTYVQCELRALMQGESCHSIYHCLIWYMHYMDSWKSWSHQDSNSMIWIECGSQDWL